ncbi:hypothetical protein Tco_0725563 [Tanacetum coccineum]|uniref:Uncharacterized protein n=1 Tax=Tanacetum coccineum TaxID=301880 RepID=A0ABQ4YFF6_9ASTR
MPMDDLLEAVPKLITRIDSLEMDLKKTKLTMGNAIVKLVKKVKKMEGFMKRRNLVLTDSEEEEPEVQGRKSQDDPLASSVQGLVTPPTTKVHAPGEEQVEDISPNTLEAAKTLSKVASLKTRSIDKGRRYKRRKESKGKKVVSSLDFQEGVDAGAEQVNTASGVNTGSIKLSTGDEKLSTGDEKLNTGDVQLMLFCEETPKKGQQEQFFKKKLALLKQLDDEKKSIKFSLKLCYYNEDWDLIRAKPEANAELSKSMLGSEAQGEDFAKKMVDLVNQRKKYFAEQRAKAKRNKPMTQTQLKTYMMNYLKNQGTWKLAQLKKLRFEEVKEEFDKLVKQVESFAPISFEATKASLKRFGEELQTKTSKRLKDDKDDEVKDDESTKKSGKRRKQMARKGMHTSVDKNDSKDSNEVSEQEESTTGTEIPINLVPVSMKTPSIATYQIIKQGEKARSDHTGEDPYYPIPCSILSLRRTTKLRNRYPDAIALPQDVPEKLKNIIDEEEEDEDDENFNSFRTNGRNVYIMIIKQDLWARASIPYPRSPMKKTLAMEGHTIIKAYSLGMSTGQEEGDRRGVRNLMRLEKEMMDNKGEVKTNPTDILTLVSSSADGEGLIKEVITETMTEPTLEEYVNKARGDFYSGITKMMINGKAAYKLKGDFYSAWRRRQEYKATPSRPIFYIYKLDFMVLGVQLLGDELYR